MVIGLPNGLFGFQEKAVDFLVDVTSKVNSKRIVTLKAPTGAGKTVILIDYIDEYLNKVSSKTAFIWLSPGKGDLEEQSRAKMKNLLPSRKTQNLFDALLNGFSEGSTTFINWELVTKRGNTSIRDGERKNLFDQIAVANRNNIDFIIVIDEEHTNNTSKAKTIIDAFAAKYIIRTSATTAKNNNHEYYEIDETEVINEGLITKALYVNEGLEDNIEITNDFEILINLADEKRKAIFESYQSLGKNIRPLVLIQFPNGQPETIEAVEKKLESLGYTYDNGLVSKWMSEDRSDLPENLTANDGTPVFLLMKQAISTGWDCPRAKILIKLREGMNEDFEVQTIGRIRRMPEAMHYDIDVLDYCYVYTFDEKYKEGLLNQVDKAYEIRRLFIKEKCKTFSLEKENRDLDFHGVGEREVLNKIYDYYVKNYNLNNSSIDNEILLKEKDYKFGNVIFGKVLQGEFVNTKSIMVSESYLTTQKKVNTSSHSLELLHAVDSLKSIMGMQTYKIKAILERLFSNKIRSTKKLLNLGKEEFYAFVINNISQIKEDFRNVTALMSEQSSLIVSPKKSNFYIPHQDFFKYDPTVKNEVEYLSNAFEKYSSGYVTSQVRSNSEQLFERYCEDNPKVDWVYKNGDSGQQYLSIVYIDNLQQKQWLFYPDYIVRMKDDSIWILETKGGEYKGQSKNIDKQIANKFEAFKRYADEVGINWGFVRDLDNQLYINNSTFVESMLDESWILLDEVL